MKNTVSKKYEKKMEDYIQNSIKSCVADGKKDFVIYPFGKRGKAGKRILNELGIQERYVVDYFLCQDNADIKSVEQLHYDYIRDEGFYILLLADYANENNLGIYRQISEFVEIDRLIDVCSPSPYFNPWNHFEEIMLTKDAKHSVIECIAREIYRNKIQGATAEAGVYKGQTARHINYLFPDRKLYLFDTFDGFDAKDQKADDDKGLYNLKIDYSRTSEEIVMSQMRFPGNCIIKKGWFPDSASGIEDIFAFVRLDMDLYDPILAGLEFFYPKMAWGGYIAVHDCRSKNFGGARAAVMDFCKEKHLNYMCMPDKLGTAVICIGH